MNIKGLERGTKLVWSERVPYGRYRNELYSSPDGLLVFDAVILHAGNVGSNVLINGMEYRLGHNQPHLRYPTELEIKEMKWPAIKERK